MGSLTSTNGEIVARVRTNINEPSTVTTPLRSDAEIMQWLHEAQLAYLHRVPQEHFPELTKSITFSGADVALPNDYMFFHSCTVTHTISGTVMAIDDCFMIPIGDSYLSTYYPGTLGAWAKITSGTTLSCGPNVVSGTFTYVKHPSFTTSSNSLFDLATEHEGPVIAYATAQALLKVNDSDAATWLQLYNEAIEAMGGRSEAKEIERA
ncbi:MAG TPA: hypothetical protein DGH68_02895 [Bacteroidetes bacterium]|jgi:hypothetical protein|nr:hypothetical protein [Bacteroidota bacterium]